MPFSTSTGMRVADSAIQTGYSLVTKFISGMINHIGTDIPTDVSILEGGGNLGSLAVKPVLGAYFRKITAPAEKYIGAPCCKILTIGNLLQENELTFVQCSTCHLQTGWAYTEEQEQLEQYLLGGFYLV